VVRKGGGIEPRRKPVQGRSREKVGYVLEAAARVFGELGYGGATTNKISERAGVSVGTLYQYFPNKDAILLLLAERHVREGERELEAVAKRLREGEPEAEELVRALVGAVVRLHAGEIDLHRVIYDEAPRTDGLESLLGGLRQKVAGEVEDYLRRLGLGGPAPDLAATVVMRIADALVHEVVLRPPPGRTAEECSEEVVRACLGYLRAQVGNVGRVPVSVPQA
jgi:AcrR family transcriptional regulator